MGQLKDFFINQFQDESQPNGIKAGLSIDQPVIGEGATLLHLAAARADLEDVTFLLGKGANPNIIDPDGDMPLYCATCTNYPNIENDQIIAVIDALLDAGASINHQDRFGYSALFGAALKGDARFDVFKHLVDRGADTNARDIRRNSLVSFAVTQSCDTMVPFFLIERGIDVEEIYDGSAVLCEGEGPNARVFKRSEAAHAFDEINHSQLHIVQVTPGSACVEALWS